MITTIAMIRLIRLACAVSAATSSFEDLRVLLRAGDRRLPSARRPPATTFDDAIGNDIGLQFLDLDGLVIGGQEAFHDLVQRADHDQQFPVVGLAPQLVEIGP